LKIGSRLFEKANPEAEQKYLLNQLLNESTYQFVISMYESFVWRYSKKKVYFVNPSMKKSTREKKIEMVKKFIMITVALGVPFDIFMKAQFEILVPYFRKSNYGISYPTFSNLISDKAIERFEKYDSSIQRRYQGFSRTVEFFKSPHLDIESSIMDSARRFYERLKKFPEINESLAVKELEILARAAVVSNVYVFSSPLIEKSGSEYLRNLKEETSKRLSSYQKEFVKRIRKDFGAIFIDKKISNYV